MLISLPASGRDRRSCPVRNDSLLDAFKRHDEAATASFKTYAGNASARGRLLDGLREADWLPRSVRRTSAHDRQCGQKRGTGTQARTTTNGKSPPNLVRPSPNTSRCAMRLARHHFVCQEDLLGANTAPFFDRHGAPPTRRQIR